MWQICSASAMCDNAVILSTGRAIAFRYQEGKTILARCANSLTLPQFLHARLEVRLSTLGVESQQVVLGQVKSGDWWHSSDTGMRSVPVVAMQPSRQFDSPLL